MVRRGVLFAVCSVFLSINSQNLLVDLSDQLFETRTWLAGKTKVKNTLLVTKEISDFVDTFHSNISYCYYGATCNIQFNELFMCY